jgi:predicted acylesterase/phospholipase RssA
VASESVTSRRAAAGADRYDWPRPPIASCFGAGGATGIAFALGVATGLAESGVDVRTGPMMGTSAGAYAAAALATDVDFEAVMAAWPSQFEVKVSRTVEVTRPVFGNRRARGVAGIAVWISRLRRVALWCDDESCTDVVAASSSPPPFAWPHKIDGRNYIDGGYASMTSVDLAPLADLLVLVTPMWDGAGSRGRRAALRARREMTAYRQAGGGRILHVRPSEEICTLGAFKMPAMFDRDLARQVFPLARDLGRRAGDAGRA